MAPPVGLPAAGEDLPVGLPDAPHDGPVPHLALGEEEHRPGAPGPDEGMSVTLRWLLTRIRPPLPEGGRAHPPHVDVRALRRAARTARGRRGTRGWRSGKPRGWGVMRDAREGVTVAGGRLPLRVLVPVRRVVEVLQDERHLRLDVQVVVDQHEGVFGGAHGAVLREPS